MNFSQFLYSTISIVIGVAIGWFLSFISQLKNHKFELEKLKIERTEPYKEKLHNLRFESYSHIWAECMVCWKEFVFIFLAGLLSFCSSSSVKAASPCSMVFFEEREFFICLIIASANE